MDIANTWRRIELWLGAHAPQVLAALPEGASEEQIASLESLIGARLPDDARLSLARHDGNGSGGIGIIDSVELLSVDRIASEWKMWKGVLDNGDFHTFEARPGPGVREGWWRQGWIPLTYDGCGNHFCLGLDPAEDGVRGQIIEFWHDDPARTVVAPSFGAWLAAFAYDLEGGAYRVDGERGDWLERL